MFWTDQGVDTATEAHGRNGEELQHSRAHSIGGDGQSPEARRQEGHEQGARAAGRQLDRSRQSQEEGAFDVRQVRPEAAPDELYPMAAAQEDDDPQRRRQRLGHQGRQRRPHHAVRRQGTPAEDEKWIEDEVQRDRSRRSG
jgi:hypothetical protein